MKTQEMIEVLHAYEAGKEIEYRLAGDTDWKDANIPVWNFFSYDYRVKPEPKLVPLDVTDDLVGKIIYPIVDKTIESMIIGKSHDGIYITYGSRSYEELFDNYCFKDGSPCGK